MYFQNEPSAPFDFQHYACLFSFLLKSREDILGKPWSLAEAVLAWKKCRSLGFITGDLNGDGDYDDPEEDELVPAKYNELFKTLGLPLIYIPQESIGLPMIKDNNGVMRIAPSPVPLDLNKYWVSEAWHWKITHFVQGNGTGKRPVIYDSIKGGSLTVANGKCVSLRVFGIKR